MNLIYGHAALIHFNKEKNEKRENNEVNYLFTFAMSQNWSCKEQK